MKESSKTVLDNYITLLAKLVEFLTPNSIPDDVKYIEENIDTISEYYKQFNASRESIWYHWENIIMSDLTDAIKLAFFSRFKHSLKIKYDRYLEHYNESTFKTAKSEKALYETGELKRMIYGIHGMLENDLIEFQRFLTLYQIKVSPLGNNNVSNYPRENEEKNNSHGMSEDNFYHLILKFQLEILEKENYFEKIRYHRNPVEPINELLNKLYKHYTEIQNRQEMRDHDPITNSSGYAPTIIKDIWMADKRIKTLYRSVNKYCELRNKDFDTIAIHIAEFRAVNKLISKMRREKRKLDNVNEGNRINNPQSYVANVGPSIIQKSKLKFEEMVSCQDFKTLIDKYGEGNKLLEEYTTGLNFAPDHDIFISNRIKTYESILPRYQSSVHVLDKHNKSEITFATGEYRRIGYAWVNNGYNASQTDLRSMSLTNAGLSEIAPDDRYTIYINILYQLAVGGAIAFHLAFLRKQLGKQVIPQSSYLKNFWQGSEDQKEKLYAELAAESFISHTTQNKSRFLNNKTIIWKQDGRSLYYLLHQLREKKYNMLGRYENLGPIIRDNFVDKNGKAFKNIKQNANGMYNTTKKGRPRLAEKIDEVLKKALGI